MDTDDGTGTVNGLISPANPGVTLGSDVEQHLDRLRYETAFEFSPECRLLTDNMGVIIKVSYAASALLRYHKEFLIGKPLGVFVAKEYRLRFYDTLTRLGRGLASDAFETQLALRGGEAPQVLAMVSAEPGRKKYHWLLRDMTDLKRIEEERADLLRKVVTAQEQERQRVARDLHDNVGQLLTGLSLGLKSLEECDPLPPSAIKPLGLMRRTTKELFESVRHLIFNLRPVALDDLGLHAALGQLIASWATQQPRVPIAFQAGAVAEDRLPPEVETAIYRVVQEALTNVFRHSAARRVSVVVERHDGMATALITDDGIGFDPQAPADPSRGKRLGLLGMRERTTLAGGTLEIQSSPADGTTVVARFPCPPVNSR